MKPPWLLALATGLGPRAAGAVRALAPLLATDPATLRQGRELLDQLLQARAGRSPEERLRRTITALREQAVRAQSGASTPAEQERAAAWVRQADSLATALALVAVRRGGERRSDLARIQARTDALFAEVFTATVGDAEDQLD